MFHTAGLSTKSSKTTTTIFYTASNAGLAVSRETNKIPSNLLAKREKSGSAFSTGIPLF